MNFGWFRLDPSAENYVAKIFNLVLCKETFASFEIELSLHQRLKNALEVLKMGRQRLVIHQDVVEEHSSKSPEKWS